MANQTILVVEDEEDLQELLRFNLAREGYQVRIAGTGEAALRAIKARPDLMVLDLMLPGIDGLEVCRWVRSEDGTRDLPILMLTARGEEADIVSGLELGADDYLTKPFSPRVLLARIKALLRRTGSNESAEPPRLQAQGLTVDYSRREVSLLGQPLVLTTGEFDMLYFLARRPGRVFTRQQIMDGVHGQDYAVTERTVDVQIAGLRKKLGTAGGLIQTVRGVGYRFMDL
ncbi:MAG: response regulator transcription factor [Deltaproteobacteria bacterium]|nr:response regulator transcription factor [Deltaproteobacteria bacterium]